MFEIRSLIVSWDMPVKSVSPHPELSCCHFLHDNHYTQLFNVCTGSNWGRQTSPTSTLGIEPSPPCPFPWSFPIEGNVERREGKWEDGREGVKQERRWQRQEEPRRAGCWALSTTEAESLPLPHSCTLSGAKGNYGFSHAAKCTMQRFWCRFNTGPLWDMQEDRDPEDHPAYPSRAPSKSRLFEGLLNKWVLFTFLLWIL